MLLALSSGLSSFTDLTHVCWGLRNLTLHVAHEDVSFYKRCENDWLHLQKYMLSQPHGATLTSQNQIKENVG
jgi:hypothetical protein